MLLRPQLLLPLATIKASIVTKKLLVLFFFCACCLSVNISASIDDYFVRTVEPSASNYGDTGLLEVPNARFLNEGSLRFFFSSSFPNEYTVISASPFSWLEANYRYTEFKNKPYGPSSYSGNQSLKDKSFDLKLRLKKESFYWPALAIGLRDIGGTGLTSSEYFSATKAFGPMDMTLGIGWGLLGTEGGFSNPFNSLSDKFKSREKDIGQGGDFNMASWFSGNAALFGGLEYDLNKYGLRFSLEYDTSYPDRQIFNPIAVKSRFNMGINYYFSESLNVGLAFERGNQFRLSFSLKGDFSKDTLPKPKPKNVISLDDNLKNKAFSNKDIFYRSLNKSLQDESIFIQSSTYKEKSVDLSIASTRFASLPRAAGRASRIVSALALEEVEKINVHSMNGDLEVITFSINRSEFDQAVSFRGSIPEVMAKSSVYSNSNEPKYINAEFQPRINFPEISWNMSPSIRHQIGGPEGFYLGALAWKTDINIKLRRNITFYSSVGINIYDTFKDLKNPSQSNIPHVRSDIQQYLVEGKNHLQRMQLEYMSSPFKDVFFRADFGYFEEMFGGYGGEIFYRPFHSKASFGLSIHKVRQRDYDQRFSFRDYEITTGHASAYYELIDGIAAHLSVGKYLAGDKGATLDISRRLNSGFTLGIFATKTDLSKEEFGEGSFDKGFYFSIPVSLLYSDFKTGNISFGLHPLTKDGGAILNTPNTLFSIVGGTNMHSINRDINDLLK